LFGLENLAVFTNYFLFVAGNKSKIDCVTHTELQAMCRIIFAVCQLIVQKSFFSGRNQGDRHIAKKTVWFGDFLTALQFIKMMQQILVIIGEVFLPIVFLPMYNLGYWYLH
jgi:hypothetical protein